MYFITCFSKIDKNEFELNMGDVRTFGYYNSFEHADEALKRNRCDMYEYLYGYALIEKIESGIHPIAEERWFYKYDEEKDGFYPIEEPKEFENFINIALG